MTHTQEVRHEGVRVGGGSVVAGHSLHLRGEYIDMERFNRRFTGIPYTSRRRRPVYGTPLRVTVHGWHDAWTFSVGAHAIEGWISTPAPTERVPLEATASLFSMPTRTLCPGSGCSRSSPSCVFPCGVVGGSLWPRSRSRRLGGGPVPSDSLGPSMGCASQVEVCRLMLESGRRYFVLVGFSPVPVAWPVLPVPASSTSEPGASALATEVSRSSILRSKAVSCVSIAEAVLSPLAPAGSWVSSGGIGAVWMGAGMGVMSVSSSMAEDGHDGGGWRAGSILC